ncbi:MAG TPA: hypothetical protein VM577_14365, partial [Anaerovoracaceae bacterium]|nr:hypothetical protein [Anaerovoracaceae bacterium]
AVGAYESGVVKTGWVLAEMIVHHELMEAFHYKGSRIFDPHNTTEELSVPQKMKNQSVVVVNGKTWWKRDPNQP